jgi:hypothetical protein
LLPYAAFFKKAAQYTAKTHHTAYIFATHRNRRAHGKGWLTAKNR